MILILISTLLFGIAIGIVLSIRNVKTIQEYDELADDLIVKLVYLIVFGAVTLIAGLIILYFWG